jgi:hypothetical protein
MSTLVCGELFMPRQPQDNDRALHFRSGRFFNIDGEWYFATRESPGHGPFIDRASAEEACRRFVDSKRRPNQVRRAG